MGVASHLGIRIREYDRRILTFIPHYAAMLDQAAGAVASAVRHTAVIVDLGIGTGALAARCLGLVPGAAIVGVDEDVDVLAIAHARLGRRLVTIAGDFVAAPLPRADAITASFALHHVPTTRQKAALFRRAFRALRRGGLVVSADCYPAEDARQRARDFARWRRHLTRSYGSRRAGAFLQAWAREDTYMPLRIEMELLRRAGFLVDVVWRLDGFAVIAGVKR